MHSPVAQLMMPMSAWSVANWLAVFTMWTVMMAAMMLPSAAPMILCFAALNRRRGEEARTLLLSLPIWHCGLRSVGRQLAQWALQSIGWVSLSGALLLIAGLFQFSRLKHLACVHVARRSAS